MLFEMTVSRLYNKLTTEHIHKKVFVVVVALFFSYWKVWEKHDFL